MIYELYHDESKVDGYWHGMLLVPMTRKDVLLEYLDEARHNSGYMEPIGFKKVRKRNRIFSCADAWIQVAVASLRYRAKVEPMPVYLGAKDRSNLHLFREIIGAKFMLFRERDTLIEMKGHSDFGSKVETTLRMGMKGGMHYLGSDEEPIHIETIHLDGYEHYHRRINKERITGRVKGLRDYCSISDRPNIIDDRSSDHRREGSQTYIDCQFLQLTDLLIGCFRTILMGASRDLHSNLAYPIKSLLDKYSKGYARMRNSRWFRSFWISECYLDEGHWNFSSLEPSIDPDTNQLEFEL